MQKQRRIQYVVVLIVAELLAGGVAYADKPSWAGGGKHQKHGGSGRQEYRAPEEPQYRSERQHHEEYRPSYSGGEYFGSRQRIVVRDYYSEQFQAGHCPPGLAKKHNGCMPPGQAKKWSIGQPLPRDVVYYDLPAPVATVIGPPPAGYKFVRVASDILMIAAGTGMVVDAIRDLGGL